MEPAYAVMGSTLQCRRVASYASPQGQVATKTHASRADKVSAGGQTQEIVHRRGDVGIVRL